MKKTTMALAKSKSPARREQGQSMINQSAVRSSARELLCSFTSIFTERERMVLRCLAEGLTNAAFLRTQIDKINAYFAKDGVAEIWITFPDPQLRLSKAKKRLTHPRFLRLYQQILRPGGYIHLKTDSPDLYGFTKQVIALLQLELLEDYNNLYKQPALSPELQIKTHYEGLDIAQSNRIHYLKFILPQSPLPDIDKQLQEVLKAHEESTEKRD